MRVRNTLPLVVFCIVTATAFGQTSGIVSKWGTDGAAARTAMAVTLDLRFGANGRVSGSITEYGNALCGSPDTTLPIDDGIVQGDVVTFVTTRPNPCPAAGTAIAPLGPGTVVTWTGTLGNDDSLSVTRVTSGVRGASGAPRAAGTQNPSATVGSRNPVSATGSPVSATGNPISATGSPVQGMTTQGTSTPPVQQRGGRGTAAPRGGGALVMHRQ